MKVIVQYYALIKELLNTEVEELEIQDNSTLGGLIGFLAGKHGDVFKDLFFEKDGAIAHRIMIFVDGSEADLAKDKAIPLNPSSRVQFFQPVGGG